MCKLSPCGHRPAHRQGETAAGTQPLAGNRLSTQRNRDARLLCETPTSDGESPCLSAESRGTEWYRDPAFRKESSCHPLLRSPPLVGTVSGRTSSENTVFGVIEGYSIAALELIGSSTSPSPSPSLSPCNSHSASGGTFCLS